MVFDYYLSIQSLVQTKNNFRSLFTFPLFSIFGGKNLGRKRKRKKTSKLVHLHLATGKKSRVLVAYVTSHNLINLTTYSLLFR